jgi:hypothetical protein
VWRRILNAVIGPPFRWFLRKLPALDPWEELAFGFALERYGDGVQYDFPRYLNGPSTVRVHSVDDVQGWLSGCSFKTDNEHFGQDHWQHPSEFEHRRVGDCDDYAVWAWRKLIELGIDARLITGRTLPIKDPLLRHAWVVFHQDGKEYLFETTADREDMVLLLSEVRDEYRPEYAVDRKGKRYSYAGALITIREEQGIGQSVVRS